MTTLDARFGAMLADLCEEAADLVLPLWRSDLAVDRKSDDSPVTEADRRAETLILERLARLAPGVPVVSEEDASEFGAPGRIGRVFLLVDPVDGTKAFVRGDPNFTVNIGLIVDHVPVAGAIAELQRQFPGIAERLIDEKGEIRRFVNVYVNEEDIRFLDNQATPLKDGDEISIIPAIAGG